MEAENHDLLYHSNERWLSLGNVFDHVWELKAEIATFLNTVGKTDDFPKLQYTDWLANLAFGMDTLRHLNNLNLRLQRKDVFVQELYSNVRAFKTKLVLFSSQISSRDFAHFPTVAGLSTPITQFHIDRYSNTLIDLHADFSRCFADFAKIETELDLESLKKFPNIKKHAQGMLVLFGSTCVCEQSYSVMNYNKSHHRSNLTNSHLSAILRISTSKITPDFDTLARRGDRLITNINTFNQT